MNKNTVKVYLAIDIKNVMKILNHLCFSLLVLPSPSFLFRIMNNENLKIILLFIKSFTIKWFDDLYIIHLFKGLKFLIVWI